MSVIGKHALGHRAYYECSLLLYSVPWHTCLLVLAMPNHYIRRIKCNIRHSVYTSPTCCYLPCFKHSNILISLYDFPCLGMDQEVSHIHRWCIHLALTFPIPECFFKIVNTVPKDMLTEFAICLMVNQPSLIKISVILQVLHPLKPHEVLQDVAYP